MPTALPQAVTMNTFLTASPLDTIHPPGFYGTRHRVAPNSGSRNSRVSLS